MARVPQVTRTIQTTRVNVLCLDIEHGEPFNKEVILPRTYKDEKHMMKHVEPLVNTDTVKAVHIVHSEVEETLYGMAEQRFIELAEVLPPRKEYGADPEATETDDENDTENNN